MKKKFISLLMAALMIFSLAACGDGSGGIEAIGGEDGETVSLTADVKLSVTPLAPDRYCPVGEYDCIRAMAMELFKETAKLSEEDNLLISPVSIMTALAMTAQGAEAETLQEFEEVFGDRAPFFANLLANYCEAIAFDNDTAKVDIANSLWIRDDEERLAVEEAFLAKVKNMDAEVFKSAFNKGTVRDINKWVKEKTDGMIDSILDEIPDSAVIYLVNALSFDNEWQHIYEKNQIRDGQFTTADGQTQKAEFMYSAEGTFLKDDKATGFIKPYKDGFSFVAIMPDEGVSVDEYVAGMDEDTLSNLVEGGKDVWTVDTGIPKFSNTTSENLIPVLENMGLTEMFDETDADFGAMATSSRGNIFVSKVAHKAFIEVDSRGTRAGAVTIVEAQDGAAAIEPETVILDRPFIYMITDDYANENLPLLIGTVETMG